MKKLSEKANWAMKAKTKSRVMILEMTIFDNLIKPIGAYIVSFLGRFVKKFLEKSGERIRRALQNGNWKSSLQVLEIVLFN